MSSQQIAGDNETINSEEEELFGTNNIQIVTMMAFLL
jgi:hypothetical protein